MHYSCTLPTMFSFSLHPLSTQFCLLLLCYLISYKIRSSASNFPQLINECLIPLVDVVVTIRTMQSGQVTPSFWQQFFRNTGLGAINDFTAWLRGCRHRSRKHRVEHKKVAVSSSRWLALSRCGVHILPTMVSIVLVAINFRGDFIGIDFNSRIKAETMNIALLQTAAKFQELLIVASLATIVFQLTRDELLFGDGIPLGLLAAGIDLTKLSFFWSPQTLGSLRSLFRGPRKYRRILLAIFLPLAGALALLAGPSCAVLLVPQVQDWPAGGTPVSLNGIAKDFGQWSSLRIPPEHRSARLLVESAMASVPAVDTNLCGRTIPGSTTQLTRTPSRHMRTIFLEIITIGPLTVCRQSQPGLSLWVNRTLLFTSSSLIYRLLSSWTN